MFVAGNPWYRLGIMGHAANKDFISGITGAVCKLVTRLCPGQRLIPIKAVKIL